MLLIVTLGPEGSGRFRGNAKKTASARFMADSSRKPVRDAQTATQQPLRKNRGMTP